MRKLRLEELNRQSVEEFKDTKKTPIIVVLDSIRSAMNVGSFFRTCDAFAVKKLILCGFTACPPHKEITKTAIGATESVDWIKEEDILKVSNELRKDGYTLVGVEQTTESIGLTKFKIKKSENIALFFGNEVDGLNDELLKNIDQCVEIQQFGTKHSLNVAVCGGVVIHHISCLLNEDK